MQRSASHGKLALLFVLAVGLSTVLAGVFGAPLLRAIHLVYGSLKFWILLPLAAAGLWLAGLEPAGISLLVGIGTIGCYRELEAKSFSWVVTGLVSVLVGIVLAGFGIWLWSTVEGWSLIEQVKALIQQFISEAEPMLGVAEGQREEIDLNLLVAQVPSLVAILVIVGLALSLVFERVVLNFFKLRPETVKTAYRLRDFKVPDLLVWLSLVGFLTTVVDFGWAPLTAVGANVLNVMVILYFFQGLAIVESYLRHYGVTWIWRFLVYTFLVIQLFFLPIFIGFVDFWFGFRDRLKKKASKAPADDENRYF